MLFPRRFAFMLCAVFGMLIGAATVAQAGPASGLVQAAPAVATTAAPLGETPRIEKAYWHHWHRHYWHRRHWHRWHHWHHWHHHW